MQLADSALRAGYRLHSFGTLTSTNDEALRLAAGGDRGRLWLVAASQSGGRGRQGRNWSSPPGNLYASLLLIDAVPPACAAQLGFVAAVALVEAIKDLIGDDRGLALKWPNDLLANGRKLAGILVEGTRLADGRFAAVLGFGVNRASHPSEARYPVTDLFSCSSARPSIDDLMVALSSHVASTLILWDEGQRFDRLRALWLAHAFAVGTPMSVMSKQRQVEGSFQSIDERGHLVLATSDGAIHIDAGDVFLMDQPAQAAG